MERIQETITEAVIHFQELLLMVRGSVKSCTSILQGDKTEQSWNCNLRANIEETLLQIHNDSQHTLKAMHLDPSLQL